LEVEWQWMKNWERMMRRMKRTKKRRKKRRRKKRRKNEKRRAAMFQRQEIARMKMPAALKASREQK